MIEWLWELWNTPEVLWTVGDRVLMAMLCFAVVILGFPVFVFAEWLKERGADEERKKAR